MTAQRRLDVSRLRPFSISDSPLWWGQMALVLIEATMFFMLIATYFYIRLSMDVWPPPGVKLPPLTLPTVALAPLVLSCIGSWWATKGAEKNDRRAMILGMAVNLILAGAFLVLRIIEWRSLSFKWSSDAHGSIVWTMLGLHTFDYMAGLLQTAVLLVIIMSGRYGPRQLQGVHVDSVFWYFAVAIWLPMYAVLYWGPRVLRG